MITCWDNIYNCIRDWQLLTVAMGVLGILVVFKQLREIRKQNELTEKSIRQTYRPLGVFYGHEHGMKGLRADEYKFSYSAEKEMYSIHMRLRCSVNNGVLKLNSLFWFPSNERIRDVKTHLLRLREITHPYMDVQLTNGQVHLQWVRHDKSLISWQYLYVVALYQDQDNNLYGTVLGLGVKESGDGYGGFTAKEWFQHYLSFDQKEKAKLERKVRLVEEV
jgi:hypothetical protein